MPNLELFIGRDAEQRAFQNSLDAMLRLKQSANAMIYGEHGMGKSALLRQFAQLVRDHAAAPQLLRIVLADAEYDTARDLADALAAPLRRVLPQALDDYDNLAHKRVQLQIQYDELRRQWERWEALQAFGPRALDAMLDAHYGMQQQNVVRHTLFGAGYASTHAASQLERVVDDLSRILLFRKDRGRAPRSFDELLDWALKQDAALFRDDARFATALAETISRIARHKPLVMLVDNYDLADAHDDWMRGMLAGLAGPVLVVLAGRRRLANWFSQSMAGRAWCMEIKPLGNEAVEQYLCKRLNFDPAQARPLLDEATAIAAGIPLIMVALGDQLASGGTLAPFGKLPGSSSLLEGHQRAFIHRFFEMLGSPVRGANAFHLNDRQRLRVLALLRPDDALLAAAWGLSAAETRAMRAMLEKRYSWMFAGTAQLGMHPLVREIAQTDARRARKRPSEWQSLVAALRRALLIVEGRIRHFETACPNPPDRYAEPGWRQAIMDMLHLLLWIGEYEQARNLLLANWIEANAQAPAFARWLFERAAQIGPRAENWVPLLGALRVADYDLVAPNLEKLEPQTRATLALLRARRLPLAVIDAGSMGTLDKRIELLKAAVEEAPGWPPCVDAYAEALSARGHYHLYESADYAAALADFSSLIECNPHYRAAYSRRGFAHHALGNHAAAIEDFNTALTIQPDSTSARYGRAAAMAQRYDQLRWAGETQAANALLDSAMEDLDAVIQAFDLDYMARHYRGLVWLWYGEPARAVRDLRVARNLKPNHAASHSALALAWAGLAHTTPALWPFAADAAGRAYTLAPNDPDVVTSRGVVWLGMGNYAGALNDFEQAAALRPDHVPTLFQRSRAHLGLQQFDPALKDVTQALEQQPEFPDLHSLHAEITLRQADRAHGGTRQHLLEQARGAAEQALQLRPRDPAALLWRAHANALLGQLDPALADVTEVLSLSPNTSHAQVVRGYIGQQQAEHASQSQQLQRYTTALADLPAPAPGTTEWAETFARRGLVLHALGNHEDALEEFDHALTIRQNDPRMLFWRGRAQAHDLKQPDKAINNFSASLKVDPKQPDVRYERGCLLLAINKPEAAANDFEAVLKLRPGDPRATAKLAEAKRRSNGMIAALPHYWTQVGHRVRQRLAR